MTMLLYLHSSPSDADAQCSAAYFRVGDMGQPGEWRKSSRSWHNDNCVEVRLLEGLVEMRNSRSPSGPILRFDRSAWESFVVAIKTGSLGPIAMSD